MLPLIGALVMAAENVKYFTTHDVQKALEGAHAPFDASSVGQPGSNEAMEAAQKFALQEVYERDWDAVVSTAVDRDHPVDIPGCKVQLP